MLPKETGELYRSAKRVSEGSIKGAYKIQDKEGILPATATPIELTATAFKASPVETVNATTQAFVNLASAMSAREQAENEGQTEGEGGADALDSLAAIAQTATTGKTARDEQGRIAIDADTMDRMIAEYTKGSMDRVRGSSIGSIDQPGLVGNAQMTMLKNAGLIEEVMFQPKDPKGNVIDPDGPQVRGYTVSALGANTAYTLRSMTPKADREGLNQPLPRRKAAKAHGSGYGEDIGANKLRRRSLDNAAGMKSKERTASYEYAEDYRQTPLRMNQTVLKADAAMLTTWEQLFNLSQDGGQLTPEQTTLMDSIGNMFGIEVKNEVNPRTGQPIVTNLDKIKKQIVDAAGVEGFVKRHANQHGNNNRITNDTQDANEQESPRVHKGAMEGVPTTYNIIDFQDERGAKLGDSQQIISDKDYADYLRILKNPDGKITSDFKRTAMFLSLGSWLIPKSRLHTHDYVVKNFNGGVLRNEASKGDTLAAYLENPEEFLKEPNNVVKLSTIIRGDIGIDDGKVNGWMIKSLLQAKQLRDAIYGEQPVANVTFAAVSSADQSSAGRTLAAFDQGDQDTIEHVGLVYDSSGKNTALFPHGNPRTFFGNTIRARLERDGYKGLDPQDSSLITQVLTPMPEENATDFDDKLGKLALMTTDYGKSKHFQGGAAAKFLKKYGDQKLEGGKSRVDLINEIIFNNDIPGVKTPQDFVMKVLAQGLSDVTNPWYSLLGKSQANAAGLLGFNLRGKLSDGSNIRVGVKEYAIADESGFQYVDPEGNVQEGGQLSERTARDAPLARSKAKWDKETQSYPTRRVVSQQVNGIGPLKAHLREVEVNAIAHEMTKARLKHEYFFGNIHDNVFGDPVYMAIFQQNIPKALKQVVGHDIEKSINDAFIEDATKALVRLKKMPKEITIGRGVKDPLLQGWTDYFDDLFNDYLKHSVNPDPTFKYIQDLTERTLLTAYSKGLWKPKKGGHSIRNTALGSRTPIEGIAKPVDRDKLNSFIAEFIIDPIGKSVDDWTRAKPIRKQMLQEFDRNIKDGQGFMKIGRDT